MDKRILDLINNFTLWKGDTYRLVTLALALQKEILADKLEEIGESNASEIVRG